jgi:competence ComEA-like helix-hairpin-helix protein
MGIQDRDYMRRSDDASDFPWLKIAAGIVAVLMGLVAIRECAPRHENADSFGEKSSLSVNINTATKTELETLTEIGPARAELIIKYRPYNGVEDLKRVPRLPKSVVDQNRKLMKTDGKTERVINK